MRKDLYIPDLSLESSRINSVVQCYQISILLPFFGCASHRAFAVCWYRRVTRWYSCMYHCLHNSGQRLEKATQSFMPNSHDQGDGVTTTEWLTWTGVSPWAKCWGLRVGGSSETLISVLRAAWVGPGVPRASQDKWKYWKGHIKSISGVGFDMKT